MYEMKNHMIKLNPKLIIGPTTNPQKISVLPSTLQLISLDIRYENPSCFFSSEVT